MDLAWGLPGAAAGLGDGRAHSLLSLLHIAANLSDLLLALTG